MNWFCLDWFYKQIKKRRRKKKKERKKEERKKERKTTVGLVADGNWHPPLTFLIDTLLRTRTLTEYNDLYTHTYIHTQINIRTCPTNDQLHRRPSSATEKNGHTDGSVDSHMIRLLYVYYRILIQGLYSFYKEKDTLTYMCKYTYVICK